MREPMHVRWQWIYRYQSRLWAWQKFWHSDQQTVGGNSGNGKPKKKRRPLTQHIAKVE